MVCERDGGGSSYIVLLGPVIQRTFSGKSQVKVSGLKSVPGKVMLYLIFYSP